MNDDTPKDQITSEQILREAYENKDRTLERPKQSIQDLDELRSYQLTKRKEYEQQLNKNRLNFNQWVRYAKWEINHNHDFPRARSIFERALDVNIQHIPFWVHYIQFELSHRNVNHARNLLDRATTTLPRVNKLWFIYVQTEETLRNYQTVRAIFERWLKWLPDSSVWDSYINFEKRYEETENVREIFRRYVQLIPSGNNWLKWINFELYDVHSSKDQIPKIRNIFESSIDHLISSKQTKNDKDLPQILTKWSDWEVSVQEYERARMIYNLLLDDPKCQGWLSKEQKAQVSQLFSDFEKNHGNKDSIEHSVMRNRLVKYESDLASDPTDYDTWWAYLKILEKQGDNDKLRKGYENAISKVPTDDYKSIRWKRYIYLWVKYALWLEIEMDEIDNSRKTWERTLTVIPHKKFTFGKVWIRLAEFELRNSTDLSSARKILGRSIGQSSQQGPKKKLFKYYINFEKKLGEWSRVRKLFEKWFELALLKKSTEFVEVLQEYIEFETSLNEFDRSVSLFELGIGLLEDSMLIQAGDEVKEGLWLLYIQFLKEEMKYSDARAVYRRFLSSNGLAKIWIAFALFESSIPTESQLKIYEESEDQELEFSITEEHKERTRKVFLEADKEFKGRNDERLVILEAWKSFESIHGDEKSRQVVEGRFPTLVQRRKTVDGVEEEYVDYIFPQDEEEKKAKTPGLSKFLANAKKWASQNS